jgi:hypothetical protein
MAAQFTSFAVQAGIRGIAANATGMSVVALSVGTIIISLGAAFFLAALGIAVLASVESSSEKKQFLLSGNNF